MGSVCVSGRGLFVCLRTAGFDYKGKNIIIRRLRRQQLLGSYVAGVDRVIMLLWKRNEWIVCLTVAGIGTLHGIPYSAGRSKKRINVTV